MARPSAPTRNPEPTEDCRPAPATTVRICNSRAGAAAKTCSAVDGAETGGSPATAKVTLTHARAAAKQTAVRRSFPTDDRLAQAPPDGKEALALGSRFRSSPELAARSEANFGIEGH